MRSRTRLLGSILILCQVCLGEYKELKPDREISVTSIEYRENRSPGESYRVEAHTSGSKTVLYYTLVCGTSAAYLEVSHVYQAAEAYSEEKKILVIFTVNPADRNASGMACVVESLKDH